MLPKQDILLKLAEIEEGIDQLEIGLFNRINEEKRNKEVSLRANVEKAEAKLAVLDKMLDNNTNTVKKESLFKVQNLELSYKTT
ncbi:hypothetical protein [Bacillus seohaeanensis]|jgi:hypothetical protein|uniref:Uncharacterized protein n=1 Tax=Bacillus seohaeanensis TaxID=284580 RepID=A0ABW5RR29_9BACI